MNSVNLLTPLASTQPACPGMPTPASYRQSISQPLASTHVPRTLLPVATTRGAVIFSISVAASQVSTISSTSLYLRGSGSRQASALPTLYPSLPYGV